MDNGLSIHTSNEQVNTVKDNRKVNTVKDNRRVNTVKDNRKVNTVKDNRKVLVQFRCVRIKNRGGNKSNDEHWQWWKLNSHE